MTLKEFLSLIQDEETRVELEIDEPSKDDYSYHHFWLSDFRADLDAAKYYRDCKVSSFSFEPEHERNAQVRILIEA